MKGSLKTISQVLFGALEFFALNLTAFVGILVIYALSIVSLVLSVELVHYLFLSEMTSQTTNREDSIINLLFALNITVLSLFAVIILLKKLTKRYYIE